MRASQKTKQNSRVRSGPGGWGEVERCGEVSHGRRWCIALHQPTPGRDCTCTEVSARYRPRMSLLFVKKVQIWPGGVNMPARTWAARRPVVLRIAQPKRSPTYPPPCPRSAQVRQSHSYSSYRIVLLTTIIESTLFIFSVLIAFKTCKKFRLIQLFLLL